MGSLCVEPIAYRSGCGNPGRHSDRPKPDLDTGRYGGSCDVHTGSRRGVCGDCLHAARPWETRHRPPRDVSADRNCTSRLRTRRGPSRFRLPKPLPWVLPLFLAPALAAQRSFVLYQAERRLASDLAEVNKHLERANLSFASALVATLDARDRYTAGHSAAVAIYARDIRRAWPSRKPTCN